MVEARTEYNINLVYVHNRYNKLLTFRKYYYPIAYKFLGTLF